MIHHWKALDLEITDLKYHRHRTSHERSKSKKAKLEELSNNFNIDRIGELKKYIYSFYHHNSCFLYVSLI